LQGEIEAFDSWEQHLSPGSLSSKNLEGLTHKEGTLAIRDNRNNRAAVKKRARMAKMNEALVGTPPVAKGRLCRSSFHLEPKVKSRR